MKLKDIIKIIHTPFILINLDREPEDNTVQVLYKVANGNMNRLLVGNEIHNIETDIQSELLDYYCVDIAPTTTAFKVKPIVGIIIKKNI